MLPTNTADVLTPGLRQGCKALPVGDLREKCSQDSQGSTAALSHTLLIPWSPMFQYNMRLE